MTRLAVLASGRGSNLRAIAQACAAGQIPARIVLVLCNVPDAPVVDLATSLGLPVRCVDHRKFPEREAFDTALLAELRDTDTEFVALAGFMRILSPIFIREYYGCLLNIHPSLLPKYKGLHTHQRALDAGDEVAGATVHYVVEDLDAGPSVIQASVKIHRGDTAAVLAQRVQQVEHEIYPEALRLCLSGHVSLDGLLSQERTR
ncbi:MAG: phosphoribosylglycinamide formyltransferase [Pseudomonadota bacterium]